MTFENFSGTAGGDVWPATEGLVLLFALGTAAAGLYDHRLRRLGPRRGGDHRRRRRACRGGSSARSWSRAWRAGSCSAPWSWPRPACRDAAAQGEGAFLWIMNERAPASAGRRARRRDRPGPVPLRAGHGDLGLADGVCLRPRRRASVLDGRALGLPQTTLAGRRHLGRRRGVGPVHAPHAGLCDDHRRLHDLPLRLLRLADGPGCLGVRPDLDRDGPLESGPLVSTAGLAQRARLRWR